MKLVPGARVVLHGPVMRSLNNGTYDVIVQDVRNRERLFVPHGTHALVIAVVTHNPDEQMFSTYATCLWEGGFFRTEASRLLLLWSPDGENEEEPRVG